MNAAQALAIAAAAYMISFDEPPLAPFEMARGGVEFIEGALEAFGASALEGAPGFRAVPDGDCIERWAAVR
jgi:hypothetical protein